MPKTKPKLTTWPTRKNGEPIFRSSLDAIFYAWIAHPCQHTADLMMSFGTAARASLTSLRQKPHYNLNRLYGLASKAQFFHECSAEILSALDEHQSKP